MQIELQDGEEKEDREEQDEHIENDEPCVLDVGRWDQVEEAVTVNWDFVILEKIYDLETCHKGHY